MADIRVHLLDASAIVKLVVVEQGSDETRSYCDDQAVLFTTAICFVEALSVLKGKCFKTKDGLSLDQYHAVVEELCARVRNGNIQIEDVGITERGTFDKIEMLSKQYGIDISDACQLHTLKTRFFSKLIGDSKPILISADKELVAAARKENLRAWDCRTEPTPPMS